ncbi:tRNA uridine-5-carboxymethylaminomethyl(34) synthesis GTPase MnmE [Estrella lausannensis]|uniref:tRNA modification GTPase MnmE n=1 Tax=Estrella lausannensis TaxID=483423 RepID=A0A0H5DRG7_9BACT|nr:tRNA uridine-5-carboxymethylaminomethyl(34) synthesis GTPase MnmE [Estrella lausannensis]CRX38788.1 tRNA modification GTPase MnmE [Estrella lausannensis]
MEFTHQAYQPGETVAAIATPPGEGGVAMIRISGQQAFDVAERVFSGPVKNYRSHTAHFGYIKDGAGSRVDEVLLLPMKGPRSFTGEDTVEIFCHGGSLITKKVLEVVLKAGARAASPGEFTFKAFMNGKVDLTQAEAIQELIMAKNERALNSAENQLQGRLSERVREFERELIRVYAILEAWVDFPDEGLEFAPMEEVINDLETIASAMDRLIATYHDGRIIHEGVSLCLIGSPNAGKSSLLNALLGKDRAIVSDIPGTTRDVLEDHMRLAGLNIKLVDTAGIREAVEAIEKEGIRRTHSAIDDADVILYVLDATLGHSALDAELCKKLSGRKVIAVWNKVDLPHPPIETDWFSHNVRVSAQRGEGIDTLTEMIGTVVFERGAPSKEEVVLTSVRHKEALDEARESLEKVVLGLKGGVSPEFIAFDMRQSLSSLGRIIGLNVTEDMLTKIFSTFCIGK